MTTNEGGTLCNHAFAQLLHSRALGTREVTCGCGFVIEALVELPKQDGVIPKFNVLEEPEPDYRIPRRKKMDNVKIVKAVKVLQALEDDEYCLVLELAKRGSAAPKAKKPRGRKKGLPLQNAGVAAAAEPVK